jgi:hypothetical protein
MIYVHVLTYLYNKFHMFNSTVLFVIIKIKWKTNLESSLVTLTRIKFPILQANLSLRSVILEQAENDDITIHHML